MEDSSTVSTENMSLSDPFLSRHEELMGVLDAAHATNTGMAKGVLGEYWVQTDLNQKDTVEPLLNDWKSMVTSDGQDKHKQGSAAHNPDWLIHTADGTITAVVEVKMTSSDWEQIESQRAALIDAWNQIGEVIPQNVQARDSFRERVTKFLKDKGVSYMTQMTQHIRRLVKLSKENPDRFKIDPTTLQGIFYLPEGESFPTLEQQSSIEFTQDGVEYNLPVIIRRLPPMRLVDEFIQKYAIARPDVFKYGEVPKGSNTADIIVRERAKAMKAGYQALQSQFKVASVDEMELILTNLLVGKGLTHPQFTIAEGDTARLIANLNMTHPSLTAAVLFEMAGGKLSPSKQSNQIAEKLPVSDGQEDVRKPLIATLMKIREGLNRKGLQGSSIEENVNRIVSSISGQSAQ